MPYDDSYGKRRLGDVQGDAEEGERVTVAETVSLPMGTGHDAWWVRVIAKHDRDVAES